MRELNFKKQFVVESVGPIVGLVIAIACAFYFRNAWALVAGKVADALVKCVLSYVIVSAPKIRLQLRRARLFLKFSIHVFWGGLTTYLAMQSGILFTALLLDSKALGFFSLAWTLANVASNELAKPVGWAVFAALSRIQKDTARVSDAFKRSYSLVMAVGTPICLALAVLAEDVQIVLLGPQWSGIAPLLSLLAVGGLVRLMSTAAAGLFFALGRPDIPAKLGLLTTLVTASAVGIYCLTVPATHWSASGIALAWGLGYLLQWVAVLTFTNRLINFGFRCWSRSQCVTLAGLAVMVVASALIQTMMESGLMRLVVAGAVGAGLYVMVMAGTAFVTKTGPFALAAQLLAGRMPRGTRMFIASRR